MGYLAFECHTPNCRFFLPINAHFSNALEPISNSRFIAMQRVFFSRSRSRALLSNKEMFIILHLGAFAMNINYNRMIFEISFLFFFRLPLILNESRYIYILLKKNVLIKILLCMFKEKFEEKLVISRNFQDFKNKGGVR